MTATDSDILSAPLARGRSPKGPVTAARQRRSWLIYGALWLLGLLPAVLGMSPAWQAAGLGLWLPGAGFAAVGGWALLLFPLTLALFAFSIIAWFWAGLVLAPVTVWLGAAVLAGFMADEPGWPVGHIAVALVMAGIALYVRSSNAKSLARQEKKREARAGFVPSSLAEVKEMASAVPAAEARELDEEQLQSARYLLDRALQPLDQWNGFTIIDQFQPAALRYQLNHMGFALGILQGAYTPNFTGYLREAQRNLITKYLDRKVWGYWVYESCWGHLNFTNFDPADRDNIMLTGWFGMHAGQYMLNSGDRTYAEPGSLTFQLNSRTAYEHDIHSIIGSVVNNYEHYKSQFCLFPCEPNWIYPICNHYGMSSLAVHDRLFGTDYVARYLPHWLEKLDAEFTDASGSIIGLRSQHTGIEFPFPVGEAGYAAFANIFAPERAQKLWAVARKEIEPAIVSLPDGSEEIRLPGKGLDPGNYRPGFTGAFGSFLTSAREFGDERIAAAAQNSLDRQCGLVLEGGVRSYTGGSNIANANAVMGRLMRTGDFRRSFVEGPSEAALNGPVLAEARYPDVLVARAYSHGDDLELALYPGAGGGLQTLRLARLQPGRSYQVSGAEGQSLTADEAGEAGLQVVMKGRTAISLRPA